MFGAHFIAKVPQIQISQNQIRLCGRSHLLSQASCSVILCNWVSVSPEVLVQVVLTTTLPGTFHVGIHKPKENDNHN